MADEHSHEELVSTIAKQMEPVLQKSKQGVYIYLDDVHKICNDNFAKMLGYKSAKEWGETDAPLADVMEEDQKAVISVYEQAVEKFIASSLDITMKNVQNDKRIKTSMIVAPLMLDGHVFTIHFFNQM